MKCPRYSLKTLAVVAVILALGIVLAPLAVDAQQAGKVYRIGVLFTTSPVSTMVGAEPTHPLLRALLGRLHELGYVYGQNLVTEPRSGEGNPARLPDLAADLVRHKVDVIVTAGGATTVRAAMQATTTIPIVAATLGSDPLGSKLIASLARPGGNVTGLTGQGGPELEGKRLDLFKEAVPRMRRVAYLGSEADWQGRWGSDLRQVAAARGFSVFLAPIDNVDQYPAAFEAITRGRSDGVLIGNTGPNYAYGRRLAEFMQTHRLPSMSGWPELAEFGVLMTYGDDSVDQFRRTAEYVDRILKGAKPADLPVEQPTKFKLVINLKTAKALGLTIPQSILIRADQVIQ